MDQPHWGPVRSGYVGDLSALPKPEQRVFTPARCTSQACDYEGPKEG